MNCDFKQSKLVIEWKHCVLLLTCDVFLFDIIARPHDLGEVKCWMVHWCPERRYHASCRYPSFKHLVDTDSVHSIKDTISV